jgi:hypothetical protein
MMQEVGYYKASKINPRGIPMSGKTVFRAYLGAVAFMLFWGYVRDDMPLSWSYVILMTGLLISAFFFRLAVMVYRADPSTWERNRSIAEAIRRNRRGEPMNFSEAERDGLVTTRLAFNRRQNRLEFLPRLSDRAVYDLWR